jgi:hypothetical protein
MAEEGLNARVPTQLDTKDMRPIRRFHKHHLILVYQIQRLNRLHQHAKMVRLLPRTYIGLQVRCAPVALCDEFRAPKTLLGCPSAPGDEYGRVPDEDAEGLFFGVGGPWVLRVETFEPDGCGCNVLAYELGVLWSGGLISTQENRIEVSITYKRRCLAPFDNAMSLGVNTVLYASRG